MKRILLAGALMVLPVVAMAQVYGDGTTADPGKRTGPQGLVVSPGDSTRYLFPGTRYYIPTSEYDKDRDKVTTWENIIVKSNLAVATACSTSAPIDVHAYRHLVLLLKATPRTGANTSVRLGIQFREVLGGSTEDTTTVFPIYMYSKIDNGTTAASVTDTTLAGHIITGSATNPWSGEYVIQAATGRNSPGNGVAATVFSYPNGMAIPLDSFFGRPTRFSNLTIRIRNLNANSPGVDITAHLIGYAQ